MYTLTKAQVEPISKWHSLEKNIAEIINNMVKLCEYLWVRVKVGNLINY